MLKLLNLSKNEMLDMPSDQKEETIFIRKPYELVTIHKDVSYTLNHAMPTHWAENDIYKIIEV